MRDHSWSKFVLRDGHWLDDVANTACILLPAGLRHRPIGARLPAARDNTHYHISVLRHNPHHHITALRHNSHHITPHHHADLITGCSMLAWRTLIMT